MELFDIIIIGGGLSGLYSGYLLKKLGYKILIVEANNRLGGRTNSIEIENYGWLDYGAQWIGKDHKNIINLCKKLNINLLKSNENGEIIIENNINNISKFNEKTSKSNLEKFDLNNLILNKYIKLIENISENINIQDTQNLNNLEYDNISLYNWLLEKGCVDNNILIFFNLFSKMLLASDFKEISFLFFLKVFKSCGITFENYIFSSDDNDVEGYRVEGGTQTISNKLGDYIGKKNILLNTKIIEINRLNQYIDLKSNNFKTFKCKNVICSIPPILIKDIQFFPKLDDQRILLNNQIETGNSIKIFLIYKNKFWFKKGFTGKVISMIGPMYEIFDNSIKGKMNSLVGFITGKKEIENWLLKSEREKKSLIINQIYRYWGNDVLEPLFYFEKCWKYEKNTKGCYFATFPPNGLLTYSKNSLNNNLNNIYWCGTETSNNHYGHMEGAIISSKIVVNEIEKNKNKINQ